MMFFYPCQSSYINPILFSKAYDENNLMRYRIQNEVLLYKPGICWACGEHPIALHVDGNFKCYRCITAKGYFLMIIFLLRFSQINLFVNKLDLKPIRSFKTS